jgi:hypothetical protein
MTKVTIYSRRTCTRVTLPAIRTASHRTMKHEFKASQQNKLLQQRQRCLSDRGRRLVRFRHYGHNLFATSGACLGSCGACGRGCGVFNCRHIRLCNLPPFPITTHKGRLLCYPTIARGHTYSVAGLYGRSFPDTASISRANCVAVALAGLGSGLFPDLRGARFAFHHPGQMG